jgi:type II secretory pathway pseudopilin PulG
MAGSNFQPKAGRSFALLIAVALIGCVTAATQTGTTLTPAQQRAQAAREARQAAAQQAAANRATAVQARTAGAQNKTTPQNKAASNPRSPNAGNTAGNTTRPGTVPGSAANPSTAQKTSGAGTGGSGTVGSGTLAWQTRVYSSTGCQHNGNSAVCTFTFSNQGNESNLVAGQELAGIQLVDDAHVPHHANAAHFLDKYGTQQPRLLVQPGDTGTYVLTFPDVNSQVSSADFHLRQQIVGGVTFNSSTLAAAGAPATVGAPAKTAPNPAGVTPK